MPWPWAGGSGRSARPGASWKGFPEDVPHDRTLRSPAGRASPSSRREAVGLSRRPECGSAGANDLAGLDALGADVQPTRGPVHQGPNPLDVRIPPSVGTAMRVGHLLSEEGRLSAHVAHGSHSLGMVAATLWAVSNGSGRASIVAQPAEGRSRRPRRWPRRPTTPRVLRPTWTQGPPPEFGSARARPKAKVSRHWWETLSLRGPSPARREHGCPRCRSRLSRPHPDRMSRRGPGASWPGGWRSRVGRWLACPGAFGTSRRAARGEPPTVAGWRR